MVNSPSTWKVIPMIKRKPAIVEHKQFLLKKAFTILACVLFGHKWTINTKRNFEIGLKGHRLCERCGYWDSGYYKATFLGE